MMIGLMYLISTLKEEWKMKICKQTDASMLLIMIGGLGSVKPTRLTCRRLKDEKTMC